MSSPIKRVVAVSVFTALQAVKLAACLGPHSLQNALLYSTLDSLYLYALPYFAVPWLSFGRKTTTLLSIAFLAINLVLFTGPSVFYAVFVFGCKLLFNMELMTSNRFEMLANTDPTALLGDSYIVKFLPKASIDFKADEPLCLSPEKAKAYAHLICNQTVPINISLDVAKFDNSTKVVTYNAKDIDRFPHRQKLPLTEIWVPLYEPGVYSLASLVDKKTKEKIRFQGNPITVPPCPSAQLIENNTDICANDNFEVRALVSGMAPLKVVTHSGETITLKDNSVEPHMLQLIAKAQAHSVQVGIRQVTDSLGNKWQSSRLTQRATVLALPHAKLDSNVKSIALVGNEVALPLSVQGDAKDAPFVLEFKANNIETSESFASPGTQNLKVNAPGTYKLINLRGSKCRGAAQGQVEVFVPPPVSLNLEFHEIADKCSGPSGAKAKLKFSGTPPFRAWCNILKDGRVVQQSTILSSQTNSHHEFKPGSVGTYEYILTAVEDKYRKTELVPETQGQYSYQQTIMEVAGAQLGNIKDYYCPGEPIVVPVRAQGKGPFKLEYKLDNDKVQQATFDSTIDIQLDKNLPTGMHHVSLVAISDARNCRTPLDARTRDFYVRQVSPSAALAADPLIQVTDPNLDLPLKVEGAEAPYKLVYQRDNGPKQVVNLNQPSLRVSSKGTYRLVEFSDRCPGKVSSNKVEIQLYEPPSLTVKHAVPSVCLGSMNAVEVQLDGHVPFTLWYEPASGDPSRIEPEGTSALVRIPPYETAGTYTHRFMVADKHYPTGYPAQTPVSVVQVVPVQPSAMFVEHANGFEICEGNAGHQIPVWVRATGAVNLTFEVVPDKESAGTYHQVLVNPKKLFYLSDVVNRLAAGSYTFRLHSLHDQSGCVVRLPRANEHIAQVIVFEAPKLTQNMRTGYCEGQTVTIGFEGAGPFNFEYDFRDQHQIVKNIQSLSRVGAVGVLRPRGLTDNRGCRRDLANTPGIEIHQKPWSRISREKVYNIHRGESVELCFEFFGTPPFTFTYAWRLNGKTKSEHRVPGVTGNRHCISVVDEGEYRVIALEDAYCTQSI